MTFEELESGFSNLTALERNGRLWEAARLSRSLAFELQRERGLDSNWAQLIEKSGDLEMALGRFSQAAGYYRSLALWEREDDLDAHRHCVFKWLHAELAQGNCTPHEAIAAVEALLGPLDDMPVESPAALALFWRSLAWPTQTQAHACLVLGRLLASLGQYTASSNLLSQGHGESARMQGLLSQAAGATALETGDLRRAEILLPNETEASTDRAKLLYTLGRLGDALEVTVADVKRAGKSGLALHLARALLNRAELRIHLNQTFEAREDGAYAAQLAPGDYVCQTMAKLVEEAAVARDGAGLRDYIGWTAQALQVGRKASRSRKVAFDLPTTRPTSFLAYYETEEASLLRRCGNQPAQFGAGLDELRKLFGKTDSPWIHRRLRALSGVQAWWEGKAEVAAGIWEQLSEEWRSNGALMESYPLDRLRREALGSSSGLDASLSRDLEQLSDSLPEASRQSFLLDKWTTEERVCDERAGKILQQLGRARWPWPLALWGEAVRLVSVAASNGSRFAAERHGGQEKTAPPPLGLRSAWRYCRWDEAVVATVTLPDRTVFCLWRWGKVELWEAPLSRLQLRALVQQFHWHLTGIDEEDPLKSKTVLQSLSQRSGLAQRVSRLPKRIRRLCVLADDQWHKVPFAAMPLSPEVMFIDRFSLRLDFYWQAAAPLPRAKGSAVVASVSQGSEDLAFLSLANSEARWVSEWCESQGYSPVVCLNAEQVTRQSLAQALRGASIFHFSGHGGFELSQGAGSGLVLHDGVEQFTFADVAALPALSLRLAVLMACHGADGLVFPGRIVTSFPQLLRHAGAAAVIAPLWEIRDDVAQRFTHLFYEARSTQRTDDAIRQALISLRIEFPGLGHWASLQLYGEGG